ncbi:MAG: putative hydro-lyase [Candidatus Zhuqueibacterota bacterium]
MQKQNQWLFGMDRGGTFTDVVAKSPSGEIITCKLLSENPGEYDDAAIHALYLLLNLSRQECISNQSIDSIRMGTTVATNALLERKGVPVCLVTTRGFRDILAIGYQSRPKLFELNIRKPGLLYQRVIEVDERTDCRGNILTRPDEAEIERQLRDVFAEGYSSLAIVFLNSYRNDANEKQVAHVARQIGFEQISVSSETMRVQKIVCRGDTATVDAYLNPILQKYIGHIRRHTGTIPLKFMKSSGGLIAADSFTAKDAIISGPAGGVIGYAHIAKTLGIEKAIGFDMGGTSTDVSRFENGHVEKVYESETAGVRIQSPMIHVITVAAGGGSILHFDGLKLSVGPDSAGASPGPACYRNGGPLAITDANLLLGRIIPEFFPAVFGPDHNLPLDGDIVLTKFREFSQDILRKIGLVNSPEQVALGFIRIANENMCKPIKEISVARGFNIQEYTLVCFGGAGAQHACSIARSLGIKSILLHPFAGVLSAYGMILADIVHETTASVLLTCSAGNMAALLPMFEAMEQPLRDQVCAEGISSDQIHIRRYLDIRPLGTDTAETVLFDSYESCLARFFEQYERHYGFRTDSDLEIVNIRSEVIGVQPKPEEAESVCIPRVLTAPDAAQFHKVYFEDGWNHQTPVFMRDQLKPGDELAGPAVIVEPNSTILVEPDFKARVNSRGHILLEHDASSMKQRRIGIQRDPVMLEIFNNLFMSIAEQMGRALQRTAFSVNIKERLDFSCALFDPGGGLVANAPHIPVHLGAMGESVAFIIEQNKNTLAPGDVFVTNDPYHGGSHLPDVTVVTPVFDELRQLIFCVASRGHHADIGGITPGSMPPFSTCLAEEGVVITNFKLVAGGVFDESGITRALSTGPYPARNIAERLSDLRAQVAANVRGVQELKKLIREYGLEVVQAYMQYVQDNAEKAMRNAIAQLPDGVHQATDSLDDGTQLRVAIHIHGNAAEIDFTDTSPQTSTNLNAPQAVVRSAILYVFRTLIEDNVPLNAGCFKPLKINIPHGSVLNPRPGAAVAGGNVETSQRIVDVLFLALQKAAASQGTMNNFTFGEQGFGYYETIAGGAGAGAHFDGADAVHTHMTNTRITDPEVMEHRYPEISVQKFAIRPNSGGKGHYCGGNGVVRQIKFHESRLISLLTERRKFAPYGLHGAESGAPGRNVLLKPDGRQVPLAGKVQLRGQAGDTVSIETPGGGGYNLTDDELAIMPPGEMRRLIRLERWQQPTAGLCAGHAQMNLLVLPKQYAADFEQFCRLNPRPCPLLERLAPGDPLSRFLAPGADIRTDIPQYRIHAKSSRHRDVLHIREYWSEDLVAFLLGCSFTFEAALIQAGIPVRHVELHKNVPMYTTNIRCQSAGPFRGKMVVSMRPMTMKQARQAFHITASYPSVHGTPLCRQPENFKTLITRPGELGINDIHRPTFGDAVPIARDEVPVFWACGVTSQLAAAGARLDFFISHSPGHMFISDRKNDELRSS